MDRDNGRMACISMAEENRRFALDKNAEVTGNISVTSAGDKLKIHLKAGNLKRNDTRMYRYKLMLLGLDRGKSLHRTLGEIKPDENGRVSGYFELDREDADGKGTPFSCFFIFMIVAVSVLNRNEPYHPVLKADWDHKRTDIMAKRTDISVHDGGSPDDRHTDISVHSDRLQNEERTDIVAERTDISVREKEHRSYNGYYDLYVKEMVQGLISRKDSFVKTEPFDEEWTADRWYRVYDYKDFPIASKGASAGVSAYGHFIFAFNDEYLMLGVPGRNESDEQPDGGASGFTVWQHIKGSEQYGYWLVMIQRNTGIIAEIS